MNRPTEAQAQTAEGKRLDKLVEYCCFGDDLRCFGAEGKERPRRTLAFT